MPTVKVNGINIYYELHGAGEPLLLIMGLGANATAWEPQIPAFSREYQVIAFDNRGSGRSDKPSEMYSMRQMADDAALLLEDLGINSAHVFGMSMGGMIAQELALQHPSRVRTLVLSSTMAGGPNATFAQPAQIAQFVSLASLPPELAIERGLSFFYSQGFIAENRDSLVERAMRHMHLMAPPQSLQRQVMAVMGFNAHGRLSDIHQPTLSLHGDADVIVPFANSSVLASGISGARMVSYEGVGHGMLLERAAEINAEVLQFLAGHRTHFVPAARV
jgi:pimeloyl-ACP methyl ester carboxylesterase